MAFWINLYNALTVEWCWPTIRSSSIREIDISPGLFANGPWGPKLVEVEGEALIAGRYRAPHPAADLARSADPLRASTARRSAVPNLQPGRSSRPTSTGCSTRRRIAYVNHPRGVRLEAAGCGSPASMSGSRRISAATRSASSIISWPMRGPTWRWSWSSTERIADDGYDWTSERRRERVTGGDFRAKRGLRPVARLPETAAREHDARYRSAAPGTGAVGHGSWR